MGRKLIYLDAAIAVADCTDYTGLAIEDVKKVTDEVVKGLKQLPSAQPYTEDEIQKMQDLESAEIEKAFQLGREDALSEIVRCKDCKHHHYEYKPGGIPYCDKFDYGYGWKDSDYCSYAERREGKAE